MRPLAKLANFGNRAEQAWAQWLIQELAEILGIYPGSTHRLYKALGQRRIRNTFTLPAMNLRTLTFDLAFAAFRQAIHRDAGTIIFEIARSEIGYTGQSLRMYAASIKAAAIAAGWKGPVFLQGDHFQIGLARYQADPDAEIAAVRELIKQAVEAGFWNIDIDASTLVDLTQPTLREQQYLNAHLTAYFTSFIRSIQPRGTIISVGGEIGEVGGVNSTVEDLEAFMAEYLAQLDINLPGLSKISIQTGTAHGGIMLPGGELAEVKLDIDALLHVGARARRDHAMVVVQHGASTLPSDAFGIIRTAGAGECHLATAFQRAVLENVTIGLGRQMMSWLLAHKGGPKEGQSESQYWHSNAKFALGEHAAAIWSMPEWNRDQAAGAVELLMSTIFDAFNIRLTRDLVRRFAPPPSHPLPNPRPDEVEVTAISSGDGDTSDLAD
ncbi:class II fructose-bisphosphate aldolase [Candidatus Woesebacteria bacterium]|nr:class II fructose-bisphosphate aldolase [Candidatus Woesebacteria bacterium]